MPAPTILVTGAGVDKTAGIDFPLAADLLPAINGYLTRNDEGKAVNALLRDKIKGLRFRFDRFINDAITDISRKEPEELRETVERVQRVIDDLPDDEENQIPKKQGRLIVRLFNQLQQIATANRIDDETRDLIEEVFEERSSEFNLDDHVVISGYSLNTADEHFNDLLRALRGKRITLVGPDVLTEGYISRVTSIWSTSADQFTGTRIQDKTAKQAGELTLIEAKADEINLGELGS